MNNTESQLIELLSKAIRKDNNIKIYDNVNWDNFINIATDHNIEGVIYSIINNNKDKLNISDELLERMKAFAFYTGIAQVRKIAYLDIVFKEFNDNNIPVIALKGLVVRELYPEPDQRSMCDADVLVNEKDLPRITEVLKNIGYDLESEDEHFHLKFRHRLYPMIEVHWSLIEGKELDEFIWKNTIKTKIINTEITTLSYEDFALHLCHHMVHHMIGMGFGLRQIADLVLFAEAYRDKIDWTSFRNKAKEQEIERFTLIIFALCRNLFNMEIPELLFDRDIIYSPNLELLIEDIIVGGVFGTSDKTKTIGNSISINMNQNDDNPFISMMKKLIIVLNPADETLEGKYSYAKKIKILKPIAGVQQIYHSRFNEDYSLIENIKILYRGIKISKDRNNLIKWLEI